MFLAYQILNVIGQIWKFYSTDQRIIDPTAMKTCKGTQVHNIIAGS